MMLLTPGVVGVDQSLRSFNDLHVPICFQLLADYWTISPMQPANVVVVCCCVVVYVNSVYLREEQQEMRRK